jgi:hypothetical protein
MSSRNGYTRCDQHKTGAGDPRGPLGGEQHDERIVSCWPIVDPPDREKRMNAVVDHTGQALTALADKAECEAVAGDGLFVERGGVDVKAGPRLDQIPHGEPNEQCQITGRAKLRSGPAR